MAFNFPANPQNGDLYEGFEYSDAIGAWIIPAPQSVDKQYVDDGLADKIDLSEKDAPWGVATLDADSVVLITQLENIIDSAPSELDTIGKLAGRFKIDTAANWAANTSVLPYGSVNVEIGTPTSSSKVKIGDGDTTWADLPYLTDSSVLQAELQAIAADIVAVESSLAGKASLDGATFTGEVTFSQKVTADNIEILGVTESEISLLSGASSNIQDQIADKLDSATAASTYAPITSPTFSGTVSLPYSTSIGNVSQEEISTLDGISTLLSVQDQLNALDTAIDAKAPIESPTFTGTVSGITKSMVGLGNVDNTADLDKPISTDTQSALDAKASLVALDAKANISGQVFTGDIEAPNLVITGDLTVQGTTTSINTKDYTVRDNMIYLNQAGQFSVTNAVGSGTAVTYTAPGHDYEAGDYIVITGITPAEYNIAGSANLTIDSVSGDDFVVTKTDTGTYVSGGLARGKSAANPDLGFAAGYNDGTYHHAGFFRDASDGYWKVFDGYDPEPDLSVFINTADVSFALADFQADNIKATGITFSDGTQTKVGVPSQTSFIYKTASYTLDDLSLADSVIEVSSSSATTITIPLDSSTDYPVGTSIDVLQTSTGQVTIAATGGVTLNGTPGFKLRTQWSSATMLKRAANTWIVFGDLMA